MRFWTILRYDIFTLTSQAEVKENFNDIFVENYSGDSPFPVNIIMSVLIKN